jgi:ATP synthase protein I
MRNDPRDESVDGVESEPFKRLSREDAQAFRASNPPVGPWHVVMAQVLVGAALVLVVWVWFRQVGLMWSALYGVTSVVVPGSLLARGVARGNSGTNMATAVLSFVLWEFVKIGAAVAMLVAAPKVVPDLSWPALLAAMIVCMKVNWLVLLWRRKPVMAETKQRV